VSAGQHSSVTSEPEVLVRCWIGLLCLSAVLAASDANAQRAPAAAQLVAGTWVHVGIKDIINRGSDTSVTLRQNDGQWQILIEVAKYPSINAADQSPQQTRFGPYAVSARDGVLEWVQEGRNVRYTYQLQADRLTMPAILESAPGSWRYVSPERSWEAKCEHNHLRVPVGSAKFDEVINDNGFYVYEYGPLMLDHPRARHLRFLTRDKTGLLTERFRLVFDEFGSPRHETLLSTGERGTSRCAIRCFFAKKEK